ncbi:cobalt-precorrin-6A reductase [Sneathiella sp. P13V-1]|uniref:cobalt-precorrin-6A reductase n=1 Tax=Sneathiella sp. P13V-1 TaxID=2697366 RepID=UPI00187B62B0|nr:cobalt-precorrin-6A reductase [Sneathiella sp. P13V-1]MBE7638142.1 cobalt-precorrin-6A reductase [Sneathiella sp. P13V-1]
MKQDLSVLLLAGTNEGAQINERLDDLGVPFWTSLAGRTLNPSRLLGEVLPHGFDEFGGMSDFIQAHGVNVVIDATHPFAAQISHKAAEICNQHGIDYLRFDRPAWRKQSEDNWIEVPYLKRAAEACENYQRIFLTIGRQEVGAFEALEGKHFLLRSIEPVSFQPVRGTVEYIQERGPFLLDDEMALLTNHEIDVVVSKNSGGMATYAKIGAARELGVPVIMVDRPAGPDGQVFSSIEDLFNHPSLCV